MADDLRAVFFSISSAGPWIEAEWDTWTNTAIGITPTQEVPLGNVLLKIRNRGGTESAPVTVLVQEDGRVVDAPPPPPGASEYLPAPGYAYRTALVHDLRLNAWAKHQFTPNLSEGGILDFFSTQDSSECGSFSNLKFFVATNENLIVADICRGTETTGLYVDWDNTEVPAYLVMGPDSLDNWQNFRQAPVVHVYSRATDLAPNVNESSILMQSRWDWAANAATGKWSSYQQVHRRNRPYVPVNDGPWADGYPVVVTRNKVRGRGRALQLAFTTEPGFDAHLMGYAIRYKVTGRI